MKRAILSVTITAVLWSAPATACELDSLITARVAEVVDPVTFELTSGETLRLEGLGRPRAPAQHQGAWAYLTEATETVRTLIAQGGIAYAPRAAPDRYGASLRRCGSKMDRG